MLSIFHLDKGIVFLLFRILVYNALFQISNLPRQLSVFQFELFEVYVVGILLFSHDGELIDEIQVRSLDVVFFLLELIHPIHLIFELLLLNVILSFIHF